MKPAAFAYVRAETVPHVFELFAEHGEDAKVIAGGQSLVAALNMRLSTPSVLIDIAGIDGLGSIELHGDMLRIGALVTHRQVEFSAEVAQHAPLLAAAVAEVAHPAIRACGTFGGAMAHADPSAEFPACALALEMRFHIASRKGLRTVEAAEFFVGLYETALAADELLVAVDVPIAPVGYRAAFLELARRAGDYAIVGVAAYARSEGSSLNDVRLAYFGVDGLPLRARHAETALNGSDMNDVVVAAAQDALARDLAPPSDHIASGKYRMHLARILLARAIAQLALESSLN